MKDKYNQIVKISRGSVIVLACFLSACGGDSSSDDGGSGAATPQLSENQKNYESVALASNGGSHFLSGGLTISTSSGAATVSAASSTFATTDSSIAASPATQSQPVSVTSTNLVSGLPAPETLDRIIVNGTVFIASSQHAQVTYVGDNVQESYFATDGTTMLRTLLGTSYSLTPLSGLISASPAELFSNSDLGELTNTIGGKPLYNVQANWNAGSAYLKVVRNVVSDTLHAVDCKAPATFDTNPTPCETGVTDLTTIFPRVSTDDHTTYQATDGQFMTVAGLTAWVANTPQVGVATPTYRVYYLLNGNMYSGNLIKAGTVIQIDSASAVPQNFYIFLNGAALASVKAALTF